MIYLIHLDVNLTNLPDIRSEYRYDILMQEENIIERYISFQNPIPTYYFGINSYLKKGDQIDKKYSNGKTLYILLIFQN